jgi:hypothetical protein
MTTIGSSTKILSQKKSTLAQVSASRRGGDQQEAIKQLEMMAAQGSQAAAAALQMCQAGVMLPGAVPGTTDPQAMFESWKLDYMTAYSGAQPVSLASGLAKQYQGMSTKSHLPIPPSGLGAIEDLVDGEPQGAQSPQGYDVPFEHKTKAPRALLVNRKDMASDKIGMVTANVIAKGNDAAMMPDFMAARALEDGENQLSFDRVAAFSNVHRQNPINTSVGPNYINRFNEKLDVPGLVKIVNGMAGFRNESNLPVISGDIQFGIIVPPDLRGDLSFLLDRDRDANGATNWAHIYDFVGIVLPTLTDPKTFYVCVLNGPVAPLYYSVFLPMEHTYEGPGDQLYKDKRQFRFKSFIDCACLIADWRMIAKSKIP